MRNVIGASGRGPRLLAGAVAAVAAVACEAKVYPAAVPAMAAVLGAEIGPRAVTGRAGDAGSEPGGAEAVGIPDTVAGGVVTAVGAETVAGGADAGLTEPVGAPARDAGEASPAADAGCKPVLLFRDRDSDGFGSNSLDDVIEGCPPRAGYVPRDGDCLDADPTPANRADLVYPGTPDSFGIGFTTLTGAESFDYDCSGREEADRGGDFVLAPANCEDREEGVCGLAGYRVPEDPRTGPGVNPLCGTSDILICFSSTTVCGPLQLAPEPFRCH